MYTRPHIMQPTIRNRPQYSQIKKRVIISSTITRLAPYIQQYTMYSIYKHKSEWFICQSGTTQTDAQTAYLNLVLRLFIGFILLLFDFLQLLQYGTSQWQNLRFTQNLYQPSPFAVHQPTLWQNFMYDLFLSVHYFSLQP